MTDKDVAGLRTLIRKYGVYPVILELYRIVKVYPTPRWSFVIHRSRQLLYASGLAIGKRKLLLRA